MRSAAGNSRPEQRPRLETSGHRFNLDRVRIGWQFTGLNLAYLDTIAAHKFAAAFAPDQEKTGGSGCRKLLDIYRLSTSLHQAILHEKMGGDFPV